MNKCLYGRIKGYNKITGEQDELRDVSPEIDNKNNSCKYFIKTIQTGFLWSKSKRIRVKNGNKLCKDCNHFGEPPDYTD